MPKSKKGLRSQRMASPQNSKRSFELPQTIWNLRGSNALTALRDALLPKLISGELRVKDAENLIQEITV